MAEVSISGYDSMLDTSRRLEAHRQRSPSSWRTVPHLWVRSWSADSRMRKITR